MLGRFLRFFVLERDPFAWSLFSLALRDGELVRRDLRTSMVSLISSFNRITAFSRFASCVRAEWDLIITTPPGLMRRSFLFNNFCLYTSGRLDAWISKNRWTAVETLFTFCPPGPCERIAFNSISSKGIDTLDDNCNISLLSTTNSKSYKPNFIKLTDNAIP